MFNYNQSFHVSVSGFFWSTKSWWVRKWIPVGIVTWCNAFMVRIHLTSAALVCVWHFAVIGKRMENGNRKSLSKWESRLASLDQMARALTPQNHFRYDSKRDLVIMNDWNTDAEYKSNIARSPWRYAPTPINTAFFHPEFHAKSIQYECQGRSHLHICLPEHDEEFKWDTESSSVQMEQYSYFRWRKKSS